ncbi:hypothetical protein [Sorangium sp. So ce590]|uniref:hypothetical protein n=1 Tax=unclassified Sorangium TaxID=2621164 RepID=UPI003F622A72
MRETLKVLVGLRYGQWRLCSPSTIRSFLSRCLLDSTAGPLFKAPGVDADARASLEQLEEPAPHDDTRQRRAAMLM